MVPVFKVFWSIPNKCQDYNIYFNETDWGFTINPTEYDSVLILRNPGLLPPRVEYLENGTIPRDIALHHLEKLKNDITNNTGENFEGIVMVDITDWENVWKLLISKLDKNCHQSELFQEDDKDDDLSPTNKVKEEPTRIKVGNLILDSLYTAKILRPNAKWAVIGTPLCFQYIPEKQYRTSSSNIESFNDRLFNLTDVLIPSLQVTKNGKDKFKHIKDCIKECVRIKGNGKHCVPQIYFHYLDGCCYLSKKDLEQMFLISKDYGSPGAVVLGNENDLDTVTKCKDFEDYIRKIFGPVVKKITSLK